MGAAATRILYLSPLRGERSACERIGASKSGEGPGTPPAAKQPLTRLASSMLATLSPLKRGEGRSGA
jgi:hypothetical protein